MAGARTSRSHMPVGVAFASIGGCGGHGLAYWQARACPGAFSCIQLRTRAYSGPRRPVPERRLGQFKGGFNRASGAGRGQLQGTRDAGLLVLASRGAGSVVMRRVPVQALAMGAAVE